MRTKIDLFFISLKNLRKYLAFRQFKGMSKEQAKVWLELAQYEGRQARARYRELKKIGGNTEILIDLARKTK